MALAVALFGSFVATLGVVGLLSPERLLDLVTRAQSKLGLYVIAGFRLLIGIALLLTAPSSRAPHYLLVLGGLSVVSGVVSPFAGARRFEAVLAWWRRRPSRGIRLWSAFVVFFGSSLVWAVFPLARAGA